MERAVRTSEAKPSAKVSVPPFSVFTAAKPASARALALSPASPDWPAATIRRVIRAAASIHVDAHSAVSLVVRNLSGIRTVHWNERIVWSKPVASFHGKYVHFDDLVCNPKLVQRLGPPVLIGSTDKNALKWVARWGDGYNPVCFGAKKAVSFMSQKLAELPVKLIYNDPNRYFGGNLDDAENRLRHYLEVLSGGDCHWLCPVPDGAGDNQVCGEHLSGPSTAQHFQ
jgi:hypothetical protein